MLDFLETADDSHHFSASSVAKQMREFEDTGLLEETTVNSIMDFSFLVAVGNVDEALKVGPHKNP